jgi:AmmeMemoRadiSam system protein B
MSATVRHPAVSGRFYPAKPDQLLADLSAYTSVDAQPCPALGCVVPHAGYMYSGHVAGAVYARIQVPRRCIILCPNHTGMGRPLAVMSRGFWQTPLGEVPIDVQLAEDLKARFSALNEDVNAHRAEHAAEVQLPFLQVRQKDLSIVPIALGTGDYHALRGLGEAIAEVIAGQEESALIIASSDMNHYEPDAITRIKDRKAIDRILALDPRGLYDVVMNEDISMCGFGPAVAMLNAAKKLGARSAELIRYATSGDISGDRNMVVGYAGVMVL